MKKINENVKVTLTVGQIRRLIEESAEDDWLDAWLKDHPEDMEKTLAWIEKTKPGMNASGKEAWARNILKKRHREGKIDAKHPTQSDKTEQANTLHELREPTPEEVERLSHEVKNYDVTDKGNPKEPDQRWFYDPKERRSIKFYKLVGFTEDGKVKVDVFSSTTYGYKEFKDGDYDDGQNHVWMDAEEHYKVNPTDKVGEAVGELKDGVVTITMRGKQKELGACQGKLFRSWRVYDKWYPAYGHGVWADRGYDRYGRRSYRESKKMNENGKVTLTLKQLKALVKEAKVNEGPGAGYTVEMKDITLLNATATVADGAWKVTGACKFTGYAQGYDWSTEEVEYEGEFEFHVNTHQINKYVEKYLPNWDPEVPEEDIKEMLERTSAYSIEDISQMVGAGWVHVKWCGALEVDQAGFDLDDRYLNGHNAEVGDFDIELYDKGAAPEGDCNNCYFSVACDDFALDVETAYQMKDEEGEPLDEETERSTNKWGVFLGGELKQAFDDFDEAAAWADNTWPDDDRVEIRELDDDDMYEIDQDQEFTCCKCGEPVKRMFAHTLGNDVYCDDCFRDAARHHRLSYEGVSVKESDSENEVIGYKKDAIRKAKARIDELNNILGMALEQIEEVEGAIDSGEINGQDDEKGYINAPEHLVQTLTELRSAVVDISDVKSELNNALISICNGFRMNHGSIVHGMRTKR